MNRFILYEAITGEEGKVKIVAEGVKFSNGKVVISVLGNIDCIQMFDNLDKCSNVLCSEKIKLYILPEKPEETKKEN